MKARFTIYLENVVSLNVVQHLAGHCELVTEQLSMQKSYISDDLNTLVRRMQSSSPPEEKKKKERTGKRTGKETCLVETVAPANDCFLNDLSH